MDLSQQSLTSDLSSIESDIKSLKANKNNFRLSMLDLAKLVQYLRKPKPKATVNALGMLKKNIIEQFNDIFQSQITTNSENSRALAFSIAKLLYFILLNINDESIKEHNEGMTAFKNTSNGLVIIMNSIKQLIEFEGSYALILFLNMYQSVIKWVNRTSPSEFEGYFIFLFSLFEVDNVPNETINLIATICQGMLSEYNTTASETIGNMTLFITNLCLVISKAKNEETIIRSLEVMDAISKANESSRFFEGVDLLQLIANLKGNSTASIGRGDRIGLYFRSVLAQLINDNDLALIIRSLSMDKPLMTSEINSSLMRKALKHNSNGDCMRLIEYIVSISKFVAELNKRQSIKVFSDLFLKEIKPIKDKAKEVHYDNASRQLAIITALARDFDFFFTESNEGTLQGLCREAFSLIPQCTSSNESFAFLLTDLLLSQPVKVLNESIAPLETSSIEGIMLSLMRNFHDKQWALDCINRIELGVIYKHKYLTLNAFYQDKAKLILNSLSTSSSNEITSKTKDSIDIVLTQLMKKQQGDEVIDQAIANDLFTLINKVIHIMYDTEDKELTDQSFQSESEGILLVSFLFCLIELKIDNEATYENKDISEPLFKVINSFISSPALSFQFSYYTSTKLKLLSEGNLKERFKTLMLHEGLSEYIYSSLTVIDEQTELNEDYQTFFFNILHLLLSLIQSPEQFSEFLSIEGVDLLFKLISNHPLIQNRSVQMLLEIFTHISTAYLPQVTAFFEEEWLFESLISHVVQIKVALGINSALLHQILSLLKEILANCSKANSRVIEDSNLIDYLIKEFIALYTHYSNPSDACFILILSILSNLSEDKEVTHLFLDESLIEVLHAILNETNSNEKVFNSESFALMAILCLNIVTENCLTSLIHSNKSIRQCIELAQKMTLAKSAVLNDAKLFDAYEKLAQTERASKAKSQLISQSFLNEFKAKSRECKSIKDKEEKDRILKEFNSSYKEDNEETQLNNKSEKTGIAPPGNSKITYEQAIASFCIFVDSLKDITCRQSHKSSEDANFYSLLVVIRSFASTEDKVVSMFNEGLLEHIVVLIEQEHEFTIEQEMVYHLLNELISYQCTIQQILSNQRIAHFFLKEMHKLAQTSSENISVHLKPKLQAITKLMSKLTQDSRFVKSSYPYFTQDTMKALSIISFEKEISINLLVTLNHLLSFNEDVSSYLAALSSLLCSVVWKKYSQEIEVLIEVMNVIELLQKNEEFIAGILEENIVASLLEILSKGNKDSASHGFLRIFTLMNLLSYHLPFTLSLLTKGKEILIASAVKNIAEPSLIINVLQFMNTSIQQNAKAVAMLTTTSINDCLIKALNQFMKTESIDILSHIFSLILKLIVEDKNKRYYVDDARFLLLLQITSIHKANKAIVAMAYDVFLIILDPKLQYQKQGISEPIEAKKKQSRFNSNLELLEGNLKEILRLFFEDIELLKKFLRVIERICRLDVEIDIKRRFLIILLDHFSGCFNIESIKQSELFLSFILQIAEAEKEILLTKTTQCLDLLNRYITAIDIDYITDSVSKSILQMCIIIMKLETKGSTAFIPYVVFILLWVKNNKKLHTEDNILKLSIIIKTLCSFTVDFFTDNKSNCCCLFYFILNYLRNISPALEVFVKVIENCQKISLFYQVQSDEDGRDIAEILYHFYQSNYAEKNVPVLVNILQIVSNLCRCSLIFKKELNTPQRNLPKDLEECIKENCFGEKLLTYQAKGALMLLNLNMIVLEKNIASSFIEEEEDYEIKGDIKQFLLEKKRVKLYSEEKCFEYVILQMDSKLEKISASNLPNNENKEIYLKDVDSCVRSCSSTFFKTKLFAKSKISY